MDPDAASAISGVGDTAITYVPVPVETAAAMVATPTVGAPTAVVTPTTAATATEVIVTPPEPEIHTIIITNTVDADGNVIATNANEVKT